MPYSVQFTNKLRDSTPNESILSMEIIVIYDYQPIEGTRGYIYDYQPIERTRGLYLRLPTNRKDKGTFCVQKQEDSVNFA